MVDCKDVNKLVEVGAAGRQAFALLSLLSQWALDCLKQIKNESRERFPKEQEKILFDKIKDQVKSVKNDLIQLDMRDLKFIGVILNDYKVGENVNFNKFLVECLLSSYQSISKEMSKKVALERTKKPSKQSIPKEYIEFLEKDLQMELDRHLDSSNKAKIDSYLNIRRDGDSLYKIYYTIHSLSVDKTFEVNHRGKSIEEDKMRIPSIEDKRLALQRVFHITGEYVKDIPSTPNLLSEVRQSLEEKGVPTKALSKYRDTLAHYQVFPLIKGNDNQVKELFYEYILPIQDVVRSTIIEIEDSFVQKIIEEKGKESKIDKSVVERLKESISGKGVQGLEECTRTMQLENEYHSMDDETKRFVDEVYQTVQRMKSVDPVMSSEGKLSEKKPKLSDSIVDYINKSKLEAYNKLWDEVSPILERPASGLENPHGDVLQITQVLDRLSYQDTSSPNNSILDDFLHLPILENIYVEIKKGTDNEEVIGSSLKKELERYFDAETFKNNDAYSEFKDSKPEKLIDLLNNYISGEGANKVKLIGFFESIGKSQVNYIPPEEYKRLVKGLGINDNIKEKLFSYSVGWRREKCVDLLRKNPPALKTIYDNILEGKSIRSSVYDKLAVECSLPDVPRNNDQERVNLINQKIEELYSRRAKEEFGVLAKINHPYAVESQIVNVYSLSEKASDKKKENRKQNRGEEKKIDIKKLRNYLSHGDALISIKDYENIAHQLVKVKHEVKDMLNDPNITLEKIVRTLDSMESHVGLKKIRGLLCPLSQSGRSTRSASTSCLQWAEIDKFNKGGAENRDPDNIIIDSEKFISSISSELQTNEEKFSKFIALASESEVIGVHKNNVDMLTDKHRYLDHLERVGKISGMVTHGMIGKSLVGDILRGDYEDLEMNVKLLYDSVVLAENANTLSDIGADYISKGKVWRGRAARIVSPFISNAFSALTVYDLINQVKKYREGDKDALVPIIGNSIELATDVAVIGVEVGEAFGLLRGVSAVTGPVGMAVGTAVMVGTGVYSAVRAVEKIDELIHLTGWEKFTQGILAFLGAGPSDYIGELMKEKNGNNQAVKNAAAFLKDNPDIQRYVFPSINVKYTGGTNHLYSPYILDNTVYLDRKRNDIKWIRARPDNPEGIDLFCLPKGDWESVPGRGTYYCDGAIGVEYTNNRTGNYTLINLGDGNDVIHGFEHSSNIFVFGDGIKHMVGGNKNDNFIIGEKSVDAVSDSLIKAFIQGHGGIDTIDVGKLDVWSKRVGRYQVYADFRTGFLTDSYIAFLHIQNINVFLGREGGVDEVVSACDTKHVDGRGGENINYLDSIIIPKDDVCSYDTKVIVNPYTRVTNNATRGNFVYFVKGEKGKEAYIEFGPSSQSNNTFVSNYTLRDIAAIDKSGKNITFSFVEDFYKTEKKINVNSSFNLTVSGADKNTTTYQLVDRTKIVIGQNNVYAMQQTKEPIDNLVKDYSSIADKSEMHVIVHSNGEVLTVGNSHWDVFMNDPTAKTTHLVGGGGENVFVITLGHEKITLAKLPISDVIIYDFDQEKKTDTLDLREIKEQLKKDIDREINIDVSKVNSDLLINLSLDDASKKEVVKIRLKDTLGNDWYKRVHILIDNTFVIEEILEDFELTPAPLIFDDNSKTIYVINPTDLAEVGKIRVKKEIGDYIFARDNDALVITNSLSSSTNKNNPSSIILNDFYIGNNQDNMQWLKIEFDDKKILLRKEIERINSAGTFSELKRKVMIDSYTAVMYAIKEQELFEAIEGNNIEKVKELIDNGVSIDARNNDGQTPLQSAAKSGNLEVVKYLIEEKHADVNVEDNFANKPLHYAACDGNVEVVKYSVEKKYANVKENNNSSFTPLIYAASSGSLNVVKYLIEKEGVNVNVNCDSCRSVFPFAVFSGNLELVKYLTEEKRANVNVWGIPHFLHLEIAVQNFDLKMTKYLIGKGFNDNVDGGSLLDYAVIGWDQEDLIDPMAGRGAYFNLRSKLRRTYFSSAVVDQLDVVKYLIEEKGADVNVMGWVGRVPLHLAARVGRLEVVKYLIEEKGADIGVRDNVGQVPLHFAASSGSLNVVKYLIEEKGANIDARNIFGQVPLHLAAYDGSLEVVKYLIEEKGVGVDVRDKFKNVPLHSAAVGGRLEVVRYLIEEKGVDIDVKNYAGLVPLHSAVTLDKLEVVKYLVGKGADVNLKRFSGMTPLQDAVDMGNLEIVKYLIEKGAKIDLKFNAETRLNMLERKRYTGVVDCIVKKLTDRLFDAVKYDEFGDVQHLINQGVSVNVKDSGGQPLLHFAASNGKLKVVKYLVEKKDADVNVKDDYGRTCLHLAARNGMLEVVKYLVEEKGADINVTNNYGIMPLHNAAESDSLEMVKYIIEEKNGNVNVKTSDGQVPLHFATRTGELGVVKYLVEEKNVNVNITDNDGATPLHVVAMNGNLEIARYLIEENNADVNVKDNSGDTPLHSAAIKGWLEIVKYLTEKKGVDVNVKNNNGYTPMDLAAARSYSNIVEHLEMKVNEKREKPRQHKRSYQHLLHRRLSIHSSNQPEISTSNASEKSSGINDSVGSIVKLQEMSAPPEAASCNHSIWHIKHKRYNVHCRHEDGIRMRMRMHRERHRDRRVQKRNVKYQDSHYYIDQPEIATSSGTKPSSWINGLLDWIKEKGGGLVFYVADKFAAKESEDSKYRGNHACSVTLEKMYSATIPNMPQSRKSQGVPKGNITNTSWSGWSSNREKVTSNVTDAPEVNTIVLNNALILGDLAVRIFNGTRHKQPIHENLLSLREKSMRFIDENMIMRTIQQGKEKFGGLDTNMDV